MADEIPFGSFAPTSEQPSAPFDFLAFIRSNPQLRDAILASMVGPTMSDAMPYPALPGQGYAMNIKDPRKIKEGVPKSQSKTIEPIAPYGTGATGPGAPRLPAPRGSVGMTPEELEVEKAFEQMRRENAGLTREQRREKMRIESEKEFNRGANMSDAEWDDLVNKSGLRRKRTP